VTNSIGEKTIELTPSDITKFAQRALILTHQVQELLNLSASFEERKPHPPEEREFILSYNKILENCRKLFALDPEFSNPISHLTDGKLGESGVEVHWEARKLVAQIRILKGTLDAFLEWLKPKEKKENT
jgi:hypothetical protein